MRVLKPFSKLVGAVGIVALFVGCEVLTDPDGKATQDGASNWEETSDFESDFGGYAFRDESEAFGDPELYKIEIEEGAESTADPDSMPEDRALAVRILWGQLEGNREAEERIDWTGQIHVSQGGLGVLRTIAFEKPHDHLLPREDRQTVGFVSHTRPHFDGLLLVLRHAPATDAASEPTTLSISTEPFSGSWTLEELRDANLVIPVDDHGNAVSITAVSFDERPCPRGFVRGHWLQRENERGVFRGVWMTQNSRVVGHIRGHFGINDEGQRVWFGKILGRGGRLIGLARGGWEPNPETPGGDFKGHWFVRRGHLGGKVGGHYLPGRDSATDSARTGFFQGRWGAECDSTPGDEPPPDRPENPPGDTRPAPDRT